MALTRCITLLQCEMPTWFYHRHRHSVCLINNHGAKLKLKRNVALCSIILGVCVCKHPRWSLFCAHTRTKIRDSSSQFTIHVIKCNCISALLPSRSHCVASLSNCSSFIFFPYDSGSFQLDRCIVLLGFCLFLLAEPVYLLTISTSVRSLHFVGFFAFFLILFLVVTRAQLEQFMHLIMIIYVI